MEQMMNFEQEETIEPEKRAEEVEQSNIDEESNIDDLMLNFGTGLNMDVEFDNPNTDLGIGSSGLNLFEPVSF